MPKSSQSNRILGFLAVLAVLAVSAPAAAEPVALDASEIRTLTTISHLVLSCEAFQMDNEFFPGPTEGFVDATFLQPLLSPVYIRDLPVLDGWGGEFLYASDGERFAIVSYGPDGLADRDYASLEILEPAVDAGDDLVWTDGHLVICPAHIDEMQSLGAQKETMAAIRSVAIAVESFQIDNDSFPGPTDGYVAVAMIRSRVEPFYIRSLPLADSWGNTLHYWSDGENYRIVSRGRDGLPDRPYDEVVAGTTTSSLAADIIFGDGMFMQWPEGPQR